MNYKKRIKTLQNKRQETVSDIIDGDSFKTKSRKYSVRLADLNTPE